MKKLSIIALVLVVAMVFTGCHSGELKLYQALEKMQEVTSMESDTSISINIDFEGLPEEEAIRVDLIKDVVNSLVLNIHQRMIQNEDGTASKARADINAAYSMLGMDADMDMSLWVDVDLSEDEMKLLEVFKLPPFLMNILAMSGELNEEDLYKEYIVYDVNELLETQGANIDSEELMAFAFDFKDKLEEVIKSYKKNFNFATPLVRYKGQKLSYGERIDVYHLEISDKVLKDLLRYTVNYSLKDEKFLELAKDYTDFILNTVEAKTDEEKLAKEQLERTLDLTDLDLEKFNAFMDTLEDVKILGDKGIFIEYGLGSDGYVLYEEGSINLEINLKGLGSGFAIKDVSVETKAGPDEIEKAENNEDKEAIEDVEIDEIVDEAEDIVIKLGIDFSTKYYNLNGDVEIVFPEVNEENSINILDLMPDMEQVDEIGENELKKQQENLLF